MSASAKFVPIPKSQKGPFFPLRYSRTKDNRRIVNTLSQQDAMIQEKDLYRQANRDRRYLDSGNVRQTKPAPWSARQRPTHFVALNLPAQCTIRSSISALHDDVKDSFTMNQWYESFVPLSRLHLTLSVLTVGDGTEGAEQSQKAIEQLQQVQNITQECILDWQRKTDGFGFALRSHMLGFFDEGRVAFARLSTDYDAQLLDKCVKEMRMKFAKAGIDIKGNPSDTFVPHITIAKISPATKKSKDPRVATAKTLPKSLFQHMKWDDLGLARFGQVNLCCMRPMEINEKITPSTNIDDQVEKNNNNEEIGVEQKKTDDFEGLEGVNDGDDENIRSGNEEQEEGKSSAKKKQQDQEYWDTLVKGSLIVKKRM